MTEKELLNERFKIIFQHLVDKGEIVKSSRNKGMSSFAEKIMGNKSYGHIIRAYLKEGDSRTITYTQAKRLVKYYHVNWSYMFDGVGEIFAADNVLSSEENSPPKEGLAGSPKSDDVYTKTNVPKHKTNIVFSSISAFASSTVDVGVHENSERFYIPGMQGEHIAFYIKGESMTPTIADGDMVICRSLDSHERIVENEIYAIVTSSGNVMVKRVQKILNKYKQVQGIKCISDNYLEHDPFTLSINEVRKLLKVERKLTEIGL
ncbi:S24 family peptidase [Aureispira anguillae]|nr:S24 family peptidase [Aureispira anguillae]